MTEYEKLVVEEGLKSEFWKILQEQCLQPLEDEARQTLLGESYQIDSSRVAFYRGIFHAVRRLKDTLLFRMNEKTLPE